MGTVKVCESCHKHAMDDDFEYLVDYFEDWQAWEDTVSSMLASVELLGERTGSSYNAGYWDCFVCGGTQLGESDDYKLRDV